MLNQHDGQMLTSITYMFEYTRCLVALYAWTLTHTQDCSLSIVCRSPFTVLPGLSPLPLSVWLRASSYLMHGILLCDMLTSLKEQVVSTHDT
jgi:hypothetical protein